jgi:hypothetical protein
MCSRARRLGDFARDGRGTKSPSPTTAPLPRPPLRATARRGSRVKATGARGDPTRGLGLVRPWKRD